MPARRLGQVRLGARARRPGEVRLGGRARRLGEVRLGVRARRPGKARLAASMPGFLGEAQAPAVSPVDTAQYYLGH